MALIDELTAEVEATTTVEESAITLIQNLKALLDAAGTDPAKLQALKDTLANEQAKLASAIASNTPQAQAAAEKQAEISGAAAVSAQNTKRPHRGE